MPITGTNLNAEGALPTARHSMIRSVSLAAAAVVAITPLGGCSNAGEGALSGAAIGALAGLGIGSLTGGSGTGAAIGAISGAVVGGYVGDQNARGGHSYDGGGYGGYCR